MNQQKIVRYIGLSAAGFYVLVGFFLLLIFTEYVITNSYSLISTGQLSQEVNNISPEDEFFIDASILVFFISSLLFTFSRIILFYYPEIKRKNHEDELKVTSSPFEVIMHISNEDERKIIQELMKEGRLYKFEIARGTGISKMKVHRIVSKLSERDIVNVTKIGRNSRVEISEWMKKEI